MAVADAAVTAIDGRLYVVETPSRFCSARWGAYSREQGVVVVYVADKDPVGGTGLGVRHIEREGGRFDSWAEAIAYCDAEAVKTWP